MDEASLLEPPANPREALHVTPNPLAQIGR